MQSSQLRGVLAGPVIMAALMWPVTSSGAERPTRSENVTIRILASAHDRGEIKPCG